MSSGRSSFLFMRFMQYLRTSLVTTVDVTSLVMVIVQLWVRVLYNRIAIFDKSVVVQYSGTSYNKLPK